MHFLGYAQFAQLPLAYRPHPSSNAAAPAEPPSALSHRQRVLALITFSLPTDQPRPKSPLRASFCFCATYFWSDRATVQAFWPDGLRARPVWTPRHEVRDQHC
jgi:hypothetical protein